MIKLPNPGAEGLERYRPIVPDWNGFMDALSRPLPVCLWTNTLRTTPKVVRGWLDSEGIDVQPLPWTPKAFKGAPAQNAGQNLPFVAGLYHIQEEVSCLPVVLLGPQPGERVLDLCAAPGSKSAQIAVAMQNTGTLISNDRDAVRHRATRGTLDRLGVANTTITVEDAAAIPAEAGLFDRVLADVPCTCEGTSRKNYSAFLNTGVDACERMAVRQLEILRRAIELCRPGGRIVYATCTYAPEENELVVDDTLRAFGEAVDLLPARVAGFESSPGVTSWNGRELDARLCNSMRIWPHQNDTGGFFIAVFQKLTGISHSTLSPPPMLPAASEADWTNLLANRFGFPPATFDPFRLLQSSKKYVSVVSRDHLLGGRPAAVSTGMPLIRAQLEYPKLTTAGAMLFGEAATRNTVDATETQAAAYTERDEFRLAENQDAAITDTGYVLVRRNGVTLGVALCYLDEQRILSMYPKVLSRAVSG